VSWAVILPGAAAFLLIWWGLMEATGPPHLSNECPKCGANLEDDYHGHDELLPHCTNCGWCTNKLCRKMVNKER
jgi:hypothetical protein